MKRNHKIEFKTTGETLKIVGTLWEEIVPELKKSFFYERVFLLGINNLKSQIIKQDKNILMKLLKIKPTLKNNG